jgi:hypothetical protein
MLLFCEDVRNETGNRVSLMGMLGPHLNLDDEQAIMKGLVVGAIIRFTDGARHEGSMQISFSSTNADRNLPPAPPVENFPLDPPNGENDWQVQIFGSFTGLEVHNGMTISCKITLDAEEYSSDLLVRSIRPKLNS